MPAQWTGSIVGEMHLYGIKVTELAAEANLNPKYLSTVLNSADTQVTAIIMAGADVLAYIIAEGMVDAKSASADANIDDMPY